VVVRRKGLHDERKLTGGCDCGVSRRVSEFGIMTFIGIRMRKIIRKNLGQPKNRRAAADIKTV